MASDRMVTDTDAVDARARADVREAYELGRKDEKASRKRHPLMMTLTVIAALVGLGALGLAAFNGSFTRAGMAVDQNLSVAASQAEPAARTAADQAGQSLKEAGDSLRTKAKDTAG